MTRYPIYIGIDPGASGGLVSLHPGWEWVSPMPATDSDVLRWFDEALGVDAELAASMRPNDIFMFAIIEKVTGYVGGAGNPGSAMFKFGCSYGALRMALTSLEIPFEEVASQVWQKALGVLPRVKSGRGKEDKTKFKNRLKSKAQQLFPKTKVTLKTADALLIAEFCRRKREGKL